ncbi:MAG: hypothetical protein VYA20_00905 [Candidatus Neomarinimicrobiota bacterium]|nr:hypothetical protein [Candidatus Neomarinimicrobiota bacterium]
MINNIHNIYLKGEKAFEKGNFLSAKKHLLSVIDHDNNYYAAYLLLFEIAEKENLSSKKIFYDALKRLNPSLSVKASPTKKTIRKKSANKKQKNAIMTIPYIKLLIQQGKILQAKKSLNAIINTSKNKTQINQAKEILMSLQKKDKK